MRDRIMLFRPLTGELLHQDLPWISGEDAGRFNNHGEATFQVAPEWHSQKADDGDPLFLPRGTLVAVVRPNNSIRHLGLVYPPSLSDTLTIRCGGLSMLPSQSGPWEGHQGYYRTTDPLTLFYRVWEQVQAYPNSKLGIKIYGDTRSGSYVGDDGSNRYQAALQEFNRVKKQLDQAEGHLLNAERVLTSRTERVFKAAYLKRVGTITQQENPPDDPGFRADSTIWVNNAGRAHRWRNGSWVSQSQADDAVHSWRNGVATRDRAKDRVEPLQYQIEPLQERLDELEDEGREEYSLHFWQNHDMGSVIEELTEMGPFEYRESPRLIERAGKPALEPRIEVRAPKVGVRRPELKFELGVNVQDHPPMEYGDRYTGVAVFGAGQGSEVLSEQRSWDPRHAVRNILTETGKDAHTKALTRSAANKKLEEIKKMAGLGFSKLTVYHTLKLPEGSFEPGDQIFVAGKLSDGSDVDRWVRVLEIRHVWGSNRSELEVEPL